MKKIRFIVLVLSIVVGTTIGLIFQYTLPAIQTIANQEMLRFIQLVVNDVSIPEVDKSALFISTNGKNELDMVQINKLSGTIVTKIEETLFSIEEGTYQNKTNTIYQQRLEEISNKGVIASIPLGSISENPFFSEVGPKLTVRYKSIGHVTSKIEKEIKNYGINMVCVSVDIIVTLHVLVIIPYHSQEITKKVEIPIVLEIMEGEVPNWYQN